jgi:hypothetical protein
VSTEQETKLIVAERQEIGPTMRFHGAEFELEGGKKEYAAGEYRAQFDWALMRVRIVKKHE